MREPAFGQNARLSSACQVGPLSVVPPPLNLRAVPFADCLAADVGRLLALQKNAARAAGSRKQQLDAEFAARVAKSRTALAERRARLPRPEFAEDLPVNARRGEIAELIEKHQVVIVCGETGSGKTTQLPKICLELGRGARGLIGHTQPRRLAARSVAARLAQELKTRVGEGIGVKIRFQDSTREDSLVKLMTDGILLAETQTDRFLSQYDTIIIDEAHERSLNIDFLLGYLKQLLPKRPDLKVIVTSATIDAERFAQHFANDGQPAPVIEVSGRLYPVETRYRPVNLPDDDVEGEGEERDLFDAISDACSELARSGQGDILVFLPGEREIRQAAEALRKHPLPHSEILPLFARLSNAEQERIFAPHTGRRIVLATNVAETSLTVPGIRYVVDTGLARVKRYSYRNKVEQLQVEKISQASANQRAGRCGRVAAGVCIRLYDENDFKQRAAFTDPEILRSSLAGVILRMKALKLGQVEEFPFLERPQPKAIADGYTLLQEIGALDDDNELTAIGREIARLPIDPRVARMIVAARDYGCLREVLIIAAALSVQDPRERPIEKQQAADQAHAKWIGKETAKDGSTPPRSEFLAWVKLWDWYHEQVQHKTSNRLLADELRKNFLSPLRMREWRELHGQLHGMLGEISGERGETERQVRGWRENELPADYASVHKALLTGLLGNVGCKSEESGYYLGARGMKYLIHPASALSKNAGKWIVCAELTETTKLYARCIARIDPDWLEEVGAHLLRKSTFDPHWEKKAMQVAAWERATLHGIVVYGKRRIHYGPTNPNEAREIFIREALVGGEVEESYARRWSFWQHNRKLIAEIESLEHKSRRPDVLVDDELIYAFYDAHIPNDPALGLHNGAAFDHWRREAEKANPKLLHLTRDDLMRHEAAGITTDAFPSSVRMAGIDYALSYHHEPGSPKDGVTLTLPLAQLNQISAARCEWLVPGLLKEKVVQLVKTLPQKLRAKLVPVPEFAQEFVDWVAAEASRSGGSEPKILQNGVVPALVQFILQTRALHARGWAVTPDAFRPDALPPHLSMNFKLIDEHGRQLDLSRNLADLRTEWGREAKQEFAGLHETPAQYTGLTDWTFGELPELMEVKVGAQSVVGYPGLTDDGESVTLKVFDSPEEARAAHGKGLLRLFMLLFREQLKYFDKNVPNLTQMGMAFMNLGTTEELKRQLIELAFSRACLVEPWPNDEAAFRQRCAEAKPRLGLVLQEIARLAAGILTEWQALQKKLPPFAKAHPQAVADIEKQVGRLVHKRFLAELPFERLNQLPRYLKAAALRLDKLRTNAVRDSAAMAEYAPLWTNYERRAAQLAKAGVLDEELEQFRWLLEELRVQLFAQELRTPVPVSVKRLQKMWEAFGR
jgi:ATP-dependent helicase HrpA